MPKSNDWQESTAEVSRRQSARGAVQRESGFAGRRWLVVLLTVALGCGASADQSATAIPSAVEVIGLKSDRMRYHVAEQQASNWCWAACVQMVLSTRGIVVSQREVVSRATGGAVLDRPGSSRDVLINLNGVMDDVAGRQWQLESFAGEGPPSFELIRTQLERDLPLIVGYRIPGQDVGHAAVITAVIYEVRHGVPHILRILVRDPSPWFHASQGKRELTREEFDEVFVHYLVIPSESGGQRP